MLEFMIINNPAKDINKSNMQGQLVDLRDAYKAIRKALFVKHGQGNECMQRDRQEALKLLRQIQHILSYTY